MTDRPRPRLATSREIDPARDDVHAPDCRCYGCHEARSIAHLEAVAEADLAAFCRAGRIAGWGIAIGTAIAFAIDARGAWAALLSFAGAR